MNVSHGMGQTKEMLPEENWGPDTGGTVGVAEEK